MAVGSKARVRHYPFVGLNASARPWLLSPGVLSNSAGFVPGPRGSYHRTPQWVQHSEQLPSPYTSIIGISPVGAIDNTSTVQITATLKGPNVLGQYRCKSDGSWEAWGGNSYGGNQDTTRTVVKYHRFNGNEYVLGWDVDTSDASGRHGCGLFHSMSNSGYGNPACPVGGEVMSHSGVTATPSTTGGNIGKGWKRYYLTYYTQTAAHPIGIEGATDHVNRIQCQTTGTSGQNSITLSGLPAGHDPGTIQIYIYATRVVSSQAQLDYEPAYLVGGVSDTTSSYTDTMSDALLTTRPQLELNKYSFPSMKQHGKYVGNLCLGDHLGHLYVSGILYDYRIYFSGYTDNNGEVHTDDDYWQYFVDTPGQDPIVSIISHRGKMLVLGKAGLYVLRDDTVDPAQWVLVQIADINGANECGLCRTSDSVLIVGRGADGAYGIWETDGYNIVYAGNEMAALCDSTTGILPLDGGIVLTGTYSGKYVRNHKREWGHRNVPSSMIATLGRNSSYRSGAPLVATTTAIYYEGTNYSIDKTDYIETAEAMSQVAEERTEWEKVFVFTSSSATCDMDVLGSVDGGSYVSIGTFTAPAAIGAVTSLGVPPSLRHGRRFKVKVIAYSNTDVYIDGVSIQEKICATMT